MICLMLCLVAWISFLCKPTAKHGSREFVLCWRGSEKKIKENVISIKDIEDPLALSRSQNFQTNCFYLCTIPLDVWLLSLSEYVPWRYYEFVKTTYSTTLIIPLCICSYAGFISLTKRLLYVVFCNFCLNLWKATTDKIDAMGISLIHLKKKKNSCLELKI